MLERTVFKILAEISIHCILTLSFAIWIYSKSGSVVYFIIFILAGIFVDLDHLLDYLLYTKTRFRLGEFLRSFQLRSGKVYVYLHSWELIIIILITGLTVKSNALLIFALGLSLHLIIDNIQRKNRFFYFLIYRSYKKFDVRVLLPEQKIDM